MDHSIAGNAQQLNIFQANWPELRNVPWSPEKERSMLGQVGRVNTMLPDPEADGVGLQLAM